MSVDTDLSSSGVRRIFNWMPGSVMSLAGTASLAAGAIHAAAVGVHNEHPQAVRVFVAVAVFQLAWGALALVRRGVAVVGVGIIGNLALIGGWVMAKTGGIQFVDGLEEAEGAQFADTLAAVFAGVAVVAAAVAVLRPALGSRRFLTGVAVLSVGVLAVPAMVSAGSHSHAGHDPASGDAAAHDHTTESTDTTVHDHSSPEVSTSSEDPPTEAANDDEIVHQHDVPVVPPKPYDPTKPIDLSGVEGVSLEEQASAENLIAITLLRLPKFADPAVAESLGWHSIGDGLTGYEHYINWDTIEDDQWLDPDVPEALVYQVARDGSGKNLVSAMFMLPGSYTLDNVPPIGGDLVQWHIHDNLCFTADPAVSDDPVRVAGLTSSDGTCGAPLVKLAENVMLHVWITPHKCGPFAALEGAGAGQIKPGEERLCDHAHGSVGTFG